ncbi:MAG: rRNA maturation RNase YbeY [Clostridia bacterium]|nr:rRNA maturation RNase YbeY [Clostridia bacterium]
MKIEYVGNKLSFKDKCVISRAVRATLSELEQPKELAVCVNIVSPEEMREINNRMRGIDKVTDVLSFPSASLAPFEKISIVQSASKEMKISGGYFIGDMAICMEEVLRQSEEYGESKKRVLSRLVVHSILHLLGFDHIKDEDFAVMEPVQNKILDKLAKK